MPRKGAQSQIEPVNELRVREVIAAVEVTGNIKKACAQVGMDRRMLHYFIKLRPDLEAELRHASEVGKAHLQEELEALVLERAKAGSDILLMFMLKKLDPSYRESYHVTTTNQATNFVIDLGAASESHDDASAPATLDDVKG